MITPPRTPFKVSRFRAPDVTLIFFTCLWGGVELLRFAPRPHAGVRV